MSDPTEQFGGAENERGAVPGGVVDGRYRLEEALGGGVTATTWRAHDPVLGRDVAVKIWTDASDDAHRSQQDELGAARLLDPNLNELLDAGSHEGRPFLVREIAAEHPTIPAAPPSAPVPTPPVPSPAVPARTPVTPVTGTPIVPARRRADRVVVTSVAAILVATLLVGVGLIVRPEPLETPDDAEGANTVRPAEIISFDPEGDGRENPEDLGALLDDDPQTVWRSDRYNSRKFGNLKPGLGLILTLSPPRQVGGVEIVSEAGGWSAQVHAADSPGDELSDWGEPVDRVETSAASGRFDLGGRTVGAVLIWFTDLGPESNRLTLRELRVFASE